MGVDEAPAIVEIVTVPDSGPSSMRRVNGSGVGKLRLAGICEDRGGSAHAFTLPALGADGCEGTARGADQDKEPGVEPRVQRGQPEGSEDHAAANPDLDRVRASNSLSFPFACG